MKKIREGKKLIAAAVLTSFLVLPAPTLAADTHVEVTQNGTVVNGISDVDYSDNGGAVNINAAQNVILDGTFANNSSATQGGAISLISGASASIADGSIFSGNHAVNAGAISNVGSTLTIGDNVTFDGNYSENYAGAILNQNSNLTIGNNVVFKNNISNKTSGSDSGAALAIDDQGNALSNTSVVIGNNALFENNKSGKSGAGVYIYESAGKINLKIGTGAIFRGNKSVVNGGAMSVYGASGTNADSTNTGVSIGAGAIFENNTAEQSGGAIYAHHYNKAGSALTIADGASFSSNAANADGGAIYNACESTIDNATFTQNTSGVDGGAIFNTGADAVLTINNSTFTANKAGDWGGAIGSYKGADLTINSGIFSNNVANTTGGAIANGNGSSLTISDVDFINNHALQGDGGAIGSFGSLSISDALFEGNTAQLTGENYDIPYTGDPKAIGGGAIALGAQSTTLIESNIQNTIFRNNYSGTNGGAIATRMAKDADNSAAVLDISNVTFENNKADGDGGAVYNTFYAGTEGVSIVGKFINNTAGGNGGAIYNDATKDKANNTGGVLTILGGSLFEGNTATEGSGGAVFTSKESTLNLDTTTADIKFSNNTSQNGVNDVYASEDSQTSITGANKVSMAGGLISEIDSAVNVKDTSSLVFEETAKTEIAGNISTEAGANVTNNGEMTVASTGTGTGNLTNNSVLNIDGKYTGSIVQKEADAQINVGATGTIATDKTIESGALTIAQGGSVLGEIKVTEAVELNVAQSAIFDSTGLQVGGTGTNGHITGTFNLKDTEVTIASGSAFTQDLTLSGDSQLTTPDAQLQIGNGSSTNTLTLSNGSNNVSDGKNIVIANNATLKLSPDAGKSMTLNNNVQGTGNVLVEEKVVQVENPEYDATEAATNPGYSVAQFIDKHLGVGTVNITSDNSGFTGIYNQNDGDVILAENAVFFGGTNNVNTIVDSSNNFISSGNLTLADGALLASNININGNENTDALNTASVTFEGDTGTINQNTITTGIFNYAKAQSIGTNPTININKATAILANGSVINEENLTLSATSGVRALGLTNGAGVNGNIILEDNTGLAYGDNAFIKDETSVTMGANTELVFGNNSTNIEYSNIITSTKESSVISKLGAGETIITSSLAQFAGSIEAQDGLLSLSNTDALNLNNISVIDGSLDIQAQSVSATGNLNVSDSKFNSNELAIGGNASISNSTFNTNDLTVGGNASISNSTLNIAGNSQFNNLSLIGNSIFNTQGDIAVTNTLTVGSSSVAGTPSLNMMNGSLNTVTANELVVNSNAGILFDANPRTSQTDSIITNSIISDPNSDYKILVSGINFTESPISNNATIDISNLIQTNSGATDGIIELPNGGIIANSEMGRYLITSSGSANALNATLLAINPQMYRGQVATIATWQNQLVVNNMLFDHMSVLGRQLMEDAKTANLKAAAYPQFAPYQYSIKDGSLWYKAYGNLERLSMTRGLSVGNNTYGSLIGADFPLVNLKNGWKLVPTAYIGYNGGHQYFDGVSMYQNGAQLGFMGTAYKNDFITSLLAYGGGYANDMKVSGIYGNGNDTTGNWFAGVASKSAYNFHVAKDLIFQPTAMIAYNAFGGQNWGSNFGAMSMSSGMLNGINMAPGFNLIWNKKTFSLYATAQMVYNVMGGVDGQAGNIDTGYVRMRHSYFEYGIGAMKQFKDRFNGYFQITLRNGGRTGIGFQGGLQIKVGK